MRQLHETISRIHDERSTDSFTNIPLIACLIHTAVRHYHAYTITPSIQPQTPAQKKCLHVGRVDSAMSSRAPCAPAGSSAVAAAGEAANDDVEDGEDTVNDGVDDGGDGAEDGHDGTSDGLEKGPDAGDDGTHFDVWRSLDVGGVCV